MTKRQKKGEAGEAARFISRNKAIKRLQLSLHAFNRLCIIKGIYPIEPKNRFKAQRGDSRYRPLYLKKDITFLQHDPLIWTIRQENALKKKLASAKHRCDETKVKLVRRNKPFYSLSQNVLERYPAFIDAIKDLSDPLTMIFLFSSIQAKKPIQQHHIDRCHRLRWEFLHYVIESQCLTKAFIATNAYYYECEILGQKILWTVPHNCVTYVPPQANMITMMHFLEFYIEMLGFVNYRLLGKVNLRYPLKPAVNPNFSTSDKRDLDNFKNLMVSLNFPMEKTIENESVEETAEDVSLLKETNFSTRKLYMATLQQMERKKLFKGLKFFISRENNRESLTLIIKNCGGEVSWPASVFPCSKYQEDDESITHQIVDRPDFEKKYLSRYYIQPQWVFDCLNSATLRPCQSYFPGATLPPHVCPFLREQDGWYVPPEEELMRKLLNATPEEKEAILEKLSEEERQKAALLKETSENLESSDDESSEEEGEENEEKSEKENDLHSEEEQEEEVVNLEEEEEKEVENFPKKEVVRRGKEAKNTKKKDEEKEKRADHKMKVMMIHSKNKKLYDKLKKNETVQARRNTNLKERREAIELTKMGRMSQQELDTWKPKTKSLTYGEKKERSQKRKISKAVKFARSDNNKNKGKK